MYRIRWQLTGTFLVAAALMAGAAFGQARSHAETARHEGSHSGKQSETAEIGLLMPIMDAERGRRTFAAKGCVVCHALNGVGGNHGPSLDMSEIGPMNPFEFAAKMWRGAEAMVALQRDELGEPIELNGQELADIIAFVHSSAEIARFSEADLPHRILDIMKKTHGEDAGHPHGGGMGHRNN